MADALVDDRRGVASAVGKLYELAIVLGFVGVVTAALYGSVVPDYRTAAGVEVGDRALTTAVTRVEAAIPPGATSVHREVEVDLPATVAGDAYRIRAVNDSTLALDHPDPAIGGRARLALPERVVAVDGAWTSTGTTAVVVDGGGDRVRVRLVTR
jgi:hypothetical protein